LSLVALTGVFLGLRSIDANKNNGLVDVINQGVFAESVLVLMRVVVIIVLRSGVMFRMLCMGI